MAKLLSVHDLDHPEKIANSLLKGGVVGSIWAHHLYFLVCNAYNKKAVKKLNSIKSRPSSQVLASPGLAEEAAEFSDLEKNLSLLKIAKENNKTPKEYLEFLFNKFPLAIELLSNSKAPKSVTYKTPLGRTIWIVGHGKDKNYRKLMETVRTLRSTGKQIVFAGSSLNLAGENTMTIKQTEEVIKLFGNDLEAISIHPKAKLYKRTNFGTSSSAISFTGKTPKLIRVGATSINMLKKYIPNLEVPEKFLITRKA